MSLYVCLFVNVDVDVDVVGVDGVKTCGVGVKTSVPVSPLRCRCR